MPDAVQEDFIDCFWQTFSHGLTPDQKAAFDAAARNEGDITPAMENEIVDKMQTSFHTKGDFSAMEPYCHDKILEFKKYVQQ